MFNTFRIIILGALRSCLRSNAAAFFRILMPPVAR